MNSKLILNILCILSFYNLQASDKKPWNFVDISKACETAIKHLNKINQQLDSDELNDKKLCKIIENISRIIIFHDDIDQSSQKYSDDENLAINSFKKELIALVNKHCK